MNLHDLRQAQAKYTLHLNKSLKKRNHLYKLRSNFIIDFNINRLIDLDIDDYVIGKGVHTFCYKIERLLDDLGCILGATAFKFGIYYGKTNQEKIDKYRFTSIWGNSKLTAYKNIILAIIELINAGKRNDIKAILDSSISPMFKGKILSVYYPDEFLNIFSDEHLKHFLKAFDLDTEINLKADPVIKRRELVDFKNSDPVMKKWTIDVFSHFLYTKYPKGPSDKKVKPVDLLEDYYDPQFPFNQKASIVDLNIIPFTETAINTNSRNAEKKPDYEEQNRRNKKLGDRGEKIVVDHEKERLKKLGKENLAKKVDRVSLKSDSYGFDIRSFNEDESERFIEVKATKSKVGDANFFLTINELRTAEEKGNNYFIYLVYDILSENPKIWVVGNPFKPLNTEISIEPSAYKVKINTKWNTTTPTI